ncbi:MAG: transposase [Acidimicrobiia bacterium]
MLSSGTSNKNDENDARSVAVAALCRESLAEVKREDEAAVLRMLAKRHRELTALRTQAVCRLHAILATLKPGGMGHNTRELENPVAVTATGFLSVGLAGFEPATS